MESTSNYNLGSVIATRKLDFNDNGLKKKILIKIGEPRKHQQTDSDYYCPFIITGIGEETVRAAYGVDSIQAIDLALKMIGALMNVYYQSLHPGKITWNNSPFLGFPSTGAVEN